MSNLCDFPSFTSALRQSQLPGTEDRRFLREMYSLAAQRGYLETESQQNVKDVARKYRPIIRKWRPVLSALGRTRKLLAETQNRCEEMYPDPIYWRKLFHPAEQITLRHLLYRPADSTKIDRSVASTVSKKAGDFTMASAVPAILLSAGAVWLEASGDLVAG